MVVVPLPHRRRPEPVERERQVGQLGSAAYGRSSKAGRSVRRYRSECGESVLSGVFNQVGTHPTQRRNPVAYATIPLSLAILAVGAVRDAPRGDQRLRAKPAGHLGLAFAVP